MNIGQSAAAFVVALLAACGGGGSAEPTAENPPAAPDARIEAFAGAYNNLFIHPNGRFAGWASGYNSGTYNWYIGQLAVSGDRLVAHSAALWFAPVLSPAVEGRTDIVFAPVVDYFEVPGLHASFIGPTVALSDQQPFLHSAARGTPYKGPYPGLAQTALAGSFTSFPGGDHGVVFIDAAGMNISGPYALNCNISGRIFNYDAPTNLMELTVTFTGPGCSAARLPSERPIEMLGQLTTSCTKFGQCPAGLGIQATGGGANLFFVRVETPAH
jgi:hypothetical protein